MAVCFGTAPAVAAFWMAFRFAHLLRRVFGEGALHLAFVPHFESLRKENPEKAARFFYDLCIGLATLLVLIVLVTELILWRCIPYASASSQEVIHLTQLLLPAIIPIVLYSLNISFLNCQLSYFLPSVAPIALNSVWIGAILFLRHHPLPTAMVHLSYLLSLAFVLQWVVTLPRTIHYLQFTKTKRTSFKEFGVILRPFALAVIGVTATQMNSALDAIFARMADPEGPAYLWYAIRLQQLPLALFGMAIASALLPPLTRAIGAKEFEKARTFYSLAKKQAYLWMVPISLTAVLLAPIIIKLVYSYGAFSAEATLQTTRCLQAYSVGLLPMTLIMILAAPFYAKKHYLVPTLIGVGSVLLNIALNTFFVFGLKLGSVSIALATSIASFVNALLLGVFASRSHFLKSSKKL